MPTDNEHKARSVEPFQVLKTLAEVSIVFGTALFVIGWSYLYGYYHGFGLPASELTFSPQSVLTYSLPIVQTPVFIAVLSTIFIFLFVLPLVRVFSPMRHPAVVLLVLAIATVAGARYAATNGRANAKRDAFLTSSTLPFVKLYGTTESDFTGCSLDEWNYRLLLRANSQIYVILPIDNSGEPTGTNLRVCTFPESRIQAVRIQVGLDKR